VLAAQLQTCAHQVETLLNTMGMVEASTTHPSDVAIIRSLPGVGRKITAWLLAEAAQLLAERDFQMLRTQGGGGTGHEAKWETPSSGDASRLQPSFA
jgi:hypothetical protein